MGEPLAGSWHPTGSLVDADVIAVQDVPFTSTVFNVPQLEWPL